MQSAKIITETVINQQNKPTQTSGIATATTITTEAEKILGAIIFRTRLAKGWNGYDATTQRMAVQTWFEILSTEKIPYQHFDELYRRSCNYQAFVLQQGKEPPEMSAQLMVAQWIGGNGLRNELEQRRVKEGRTLGENAESVCKHCFGTGYREVGEGNYKGVKKCDHRD